MILSEMQRIYGQITICFNDTEWHGVNNKSSGYSSVKEGQKEPNYFNVPFRQGRDLDFEETFPSWNKKLPVSLNAFDSIGENKFPLKTLPGGSTGYSIPLSVTRYSDLPEKDAAECLPLSPDLSEIMATSNDYKLRTYVWQVLLSFNSFETSGCS